MGDRRDSYDDHGLTTHHEWVIQIGPVGGRGHGDDKIKSSPQSIADTLPAPSRTSSNGPVLGSGAMSPEPSSGNLFAPRDQMSKVVLTVMCVTSLCCRDLMGANSAAVFSWD